MEHDLQLRAAARAREDWPPVGSDDAERFGTVHYRQAVGAAQKERVLLAHQPVQPSRSRWMRSMRDTIT
jgi:hypothetical protein